MTTAQREALADMQAARLLAERYARRDGDPVAEGVVVRSPFIDTFAAAVEWAEAQEAEARAALGGGAVNAFTGPQGKGAMRRRREDKRFEAEERQLDVAHERTRAHREGRCRDCTGVSLLAEIFTGEAS